MDFDIVGVFATEFAGFGPQLRGQAIRLVVPFVSRQNIHLHDIRPVFAHKRPFEENTFFRTAFGRVYHCEPAIFEISSFDFVGGSTVLVSKGFQHAVVHQAGKFADCADVTCQ